LTTGPLDEQIDVDEDLESHCGVVLARLREGRVVPFLGSGANLCGRPTGSDWETAGYLPSGQELAKWLADKYSYRTKPPELIRVSQWVNAVTGGDVLYTDLRGLFTKEYEPTALHRMLARVPRFVRQWRTEGKKSHYQLIVTTNYDDALESAFKKVDEDYDLVTYVAQGQDQGNFVHQAPDGTSRVIERPREDATLSLDERTVILKIHGAVHREDPERDSYVITEDNYIDYLAQKDISNLIPVTLMSSMSESHFLFLGYSLADWNLRVILQRIWGKQEFDKRFQSWAIQLNPTQLEQKLWAARRVDIFNRDLDQYVRVFERVVLGGGPEEPSS
jgi:SIR2-like protein